MEIRGRIPEKKSESTNFWKYNLMCVSLLSSWIKLIEKA